MDKTNIASKPTISRKRASQINYGKILTYLILSLGAIVAIVPFLWMLSASLMNLTEATGRAVLPRIAQWSNYQEAWTGANFKGFFANSVIIAAITISGQVLFCTLAAYAFARVKFPASNFLFTLMLATLMIPEAVTWIPNFITVTCMQCDEPWCEKSCPKTAITKDMSSGVVSVDDVKCVGCRTCVSACPFGMIKYDDITGKADKCNLCGGDTPECVAFCPTQCLTLGEEDKPLRQKVLRFVNTMKDGQMEV